MSTNGESPDRSRRVTDPIGLPEYVRPYLRKLQEELEGLRDEVEANRRAIVGLRSVHAQVAAVQAELIALRAELAAERRHRARWQVPMLGAAVAVGVMLGRALGAW